MRHQSTIRNTIVAAAFVALTCVSASANIGIPTKEIHAYLEREAVEVVIKGDEAEVTGTFKFAVKAGDSYAGLRLYLPVYAAEGTLETDMMPTISKGDLPLEVAFVKKEWEGGSDITGFGKLPELEGQRVYWFMVSHVDYGDRARDLEVKMRYKQKLSGGKFIYTPLIPKMVPGKDYGTITISADKPLTLINADKHDFVKDGDKLVVKPADKLGIIVATDQKTTEKLP